MCKKFSIVKCRKMNMLALLSRFPGDPEKLVHVEGISAEIGNRRLCVRMSKTDGSVEGPIISAWDHELKNVSSAVNSECYSIPEFICFQIDADDIEHLSKRGGSTVIHAYRDDNHFCESKKDINIKLFLSDHPTLKISIADFVDKKQAFASLVESAEEVEVDA